MEGDQEGVRVFVIISMPVGPQKQFSRHERGGRDRNSSKHEGESLRLLDQDQDQQKQKQKTRRFSRVTIPCSINKAGGELEGK